MTVIWRFFISFSQPVGKVFFLHLWVSKLCMCFDSDSCSRWLDMRGSTTFTLINAQTQLIWNVVRYYETCCWSCITLWSSSTRQTKTMLLDCTLSSPWRNSTLPLLPSSFPHLNSPNKYLYWTLLYSKCILQLVNTGVNIITKSPHQFPPTSWIKHILLKKNRKKRFVCVRPR